MIKLEILETTPLLLPREWISLVLPAQRLLGLQGALKGHQLGKGRLQDGRWRVQGWNWGVFEGLALHPVFEAQ